jgi:hypothetical protein
VGQQLIGGDTKNGQYSPEFDYSIPQRTITSLHIDEILLRQACYHRKVRLLLPNISSEVLMDLASADIDLPWQSLFGKLSSKLTLFLRGWDGLIFEMCSEMEQLQRRAYQRALSAKNGHG